MAKYEISTLEEGGFASNPAATITEITAFPLDENLLESFDLDHRPDAPDVPLGSRIHVLQLSEIAGVRVVDMVTDTGYVLRESEPQYRYPDGWYSNKLLFANGMV